MSNPNKRYRKVVNVDHHRIDKVHDQSDTAANSPRIEYDPDTQSFLICCDDNRTLRFEMRISDSALQNAKRIATGGSVVVFEEHGRQAQSVKFIDPDDPDDADFAALAAE